MCSEQAIDKLNGDMTEMDVYSKLASFRLIERCYLEN